MKINIYEEDKMQIKAYKDQLFVYVMIYMRNNYLC